MNCTEFTFIIDLITQQHCLFLFPFLKFSFYFGSIEETLVLGILNIFLSCVFIIPKDFFFLLIHVNGSGFDQDVIDNFFFLMFFNKRNN